MKKKSELEKAIESLPPCPKKAHIWTLEQDAVILKYIEEKGAEAIGKVLGIQGQNVRRRYNYLKVRMK